MTVLIVAAGRWGRVGLGGNFPFFFVTFHDRYIFIYLYLYDENIPKQ